MTVKLYAVCGNYWDGFDLQNGFETLWFDIAAVAGDIDSMAAAYRDFVLRWMSPNRESRKPYIFYNTWNYQERHKAWENGPYLEPLREERMLKKIDIAHRMGVDVFVIDTGWYAKTGDWRVNTDFFPQGLTPLKERFDSYGMKLGLWFSPTRAAVSSSIVENNSECIMSRDGKQHEPRPVWETEQSYSMCLVSSYWEAFADELIRCVKELGVSYFKWDAIGQYGCDADSHHHGGPDNSMAERADCYAFEQVRYMSRIIDRLVRACPEAIVDFDITEGGRSVGLAFLAPGKFFLINNGPYYKCFDDPQKAPGGGMGSNVFVFPGPARARLCRHPLGYDKWIPSVLFLTHYLPDDPDSSQLLNIASMILGQNGIWGDLPSVSESGVDLYNLLLGKYKAVRDDITRTQPVRRGFVGCSPEIHEKIAADTGRGAVVCFSNSGGTAFRYVTAAGVTDTFYGTAGASVAINEERRAVIDFEFSKGGAIIVYFGTA